MTSLETVPLSSENFPFDFSLPTQTQQIPEIVTFPAITPIERIDHIDLLNFKSFSNTHFVGPFLLNTTIVGPNGSGKSNIIDAICFVLGISVSSLRSSHLKDLIHKSLANKPITKKQMKSQIEKPEILTSVTLSLNLINGETLELKRTIDSNYKSQVFINDDEFHWVHYTKFLHMCNIVTNPASFLILQSETYNIIEKSPKELIEYFEKMCGSFELKEKYSELKNNMESMQNEIKENTIALSSMKTERKKLRQQIQYTEEYKKLVDELETLENQIYGLNFLKFDVVLSRKSKEFQEKTQILEDSRKSQEKERLEKQKKALYYKKKRDEHKKLEDKQAKKKKELAENRMELSKITEESNYSSKLLAAKELSLRKIEEEFLLMKGNLDKLNLRESEILKELQNCEKELEVDENNQDSAKFKKNFNEYLQFQKEAEVKLQPLKLEMQKLLNHEKKLLEKIEELKKKQEDLEASISNSNLKSKEVAINIETSQQNIAELAQSQKQLTTSYDTLNKKLHNTTEKREKLLQLKGKKEGLLSEAQYLINSMHDLKEKNELFYEFRTIKGFREDISTLISPLRPEFDLPLRIALGAALDYIVVDSMEVAKQINTILREKGLQKDVLILENIPAVKRKINANLIGNHGLLAENTISFRREIPKMEETIAFLLQGKIICETSKQAETIKSNFLKKKSDMPKEIITYDGVIIRQGVITSYGNLERMKEGKKFSKLLDQKSMELKINKEQEIEKIKLELKKNEEEIKDYNTNQEEKELRKIEIKLQENKAKLALAENELKGFAENKKSVEQQMKSLEDNLRKLMVEKAKIEKELNKLREEIKENEKTFTKEQNTIYKPLYQKLKISDISEIKGKDYEQLDRIYEKKLSFTKALESIRLEIKNNKANVLENNIKNLKSSLENEANAYENAQKNFKKLEKNSLEINKDLDSIKEELNQLQNLLNLEENEEAKNLSILQQLESDLSQKEREIREIEVSIHQNLNKKLQLHEELKIKSFTLPLLDHPSKYELEFSQIESKLFPTTSRSQRKPKIHLDYDSLNMGKLLKELIVSNMEIEDEKDEEKIEEILKVLEIKSVEKKIEEMENDVKNKSDKIEEYTSNLMQNSYSNVFNEKIAKYDTKIKDLIKQQDVLLEKEKKVSEEFEGNKKTRNEKFMGFFEEVKKIVDEIYKNLTKSDKTYDVGGSALLYLENQNDPFNGGIIYSPTPPNKRYVFDSEQLSGGEKTMGGLALIFALNIAAKTRFMIFDETDAFLDFENSQKFTEFIKEVSEKAEIQILVVSHKKNIYENCQSLIGVTYSGKFNTSQAFSLDLRIK